MLLACYWDAIMLVECLLMQFECFQISIGIPLECYWNAFGILLECYWNVNKI